MLTEVASPTKLSDVKEVGRAINSWEEKYTKLHNEFGETLTDPMNIAVVLNIMPWTHWYGRHVRQHGLQDKVDGGPEDIHGPRGTCSDGHRTSRGRSCGKDVGDMAASRA